MITDFDILIAAPILSKTCRVCLQIITDKKAYKSLLEASPVYSYIYWYKKSAITTKAMLSNSVSINLIWLLNFPQSAILRLFCNEPRDNFQVFLFHSKNYGSSLTGWNVNIDIHKVEGFTMAMTSVNKDNRMVCVDGMLIKSNIKIKAHHFILWVVLLVKSYNNEFIV